MSIIILFCIITIVPQIRLAIWLLNTTPGPIFVPNAASIVLVVKLLADILIGFHSMRKCLLDWCSSIALRCDMSRCNEMAVYSCHVIWLSVRVYAFVRIQRCGIVGPRILRLMENQSYLI